MNRSVVLDYDGTITVRDTLRMALAEFGDRDVVAAADAQLHRGEIGLREEIPMQFATVRAPLGEVVAWLLEHARVRLGFREFAAQFRPVVVSSGFHELIEPVLERESVELELHANRVEASPDGWRVDWRYPDDCEVCGESCKRSLLPPGYVVYVGDGISDRCAALAADRVFATDGLADYLAERGAAFEPFTDFRALSEALSVRG